MDTPNWYHCLLVEINPRIQGGAPVLRGTRLPVSAILDNFDYGVSAQEIARLFDVPLDQVQALLAYAESQRVASPVR